MKAPILRVTRKIRFETQKCTRLDNNWEIEDDEERSVGVVDVVPLRCGMFARNFERVFEVYLRTPFML